MKARDFPTVILLLLLLLLHFKVLEVLFLLLKEILAYATSVHQLHGY
jgi:hypothetical protein